MGVNLKRFSGLDIDDDDECLVFGLMRNEIFANQTTIPILRTIGCNTIL